MTREELQHRLPPLEQMRSSRVIEIRLAGVERLEAVLLFRGIVLCIRGEGLDETVPYEAERSIKGV